jgi:hypothetical protein
LLGAKKKPEPDQTQLIATGPAVVVARFWHQSGCWLPYFKNYQKTPETGCNQLQLGFLQLCVRYYLN